MAKRQIQMLAAYWDISLGEHPSAVLENSFYNFMPAYKDESIPEHLAEFELPLIPCLNGHNIVVDDTIQTLLDIDYKTPISPLFARDLCGRVVYLGYGPEEKNIDHWTGEAYITFPRDCRLVTEDIPGAELIENVFLTRFRTLDMCTNYDDANKRAGDEAYAGSYSHANLYPYKLRLDTFYQDGWRLPQTNMIYTRHRGITPSEADEVGRGFMELWVKRPENQSYEDFYELNGGEGWFEQLFDKGCTVIPTFEATNGYNKVNSNFELTGYYDGRAVQGLHKVEKQIDSDAPKGTILKVIEPGYALQHKVIPARVVVSNGAKYHEETSGAPHPLLPDLRLPHQRTQAVWGATWLPTHPSHFEEPAIWGWDQETGRFLQLTGPLWDPLHYYYESVDAVVRAHKLPLKDNKQLSPVPPEMKKRFYPIIPMTGFDTFSLETKKWRLENGILPKSGIARTPTEKPTCTIGYHPLPMQFEYELDSFWFPHLNPKQRIKHTEDANILSRLADPIECTVSPHVYLDAIREDMEIERLTRPKMLITGTGNPLKDYPVLQRYTPKREFSAEEVIKSTPIYLAEPDLERLYFEENIQDQELKEISEATKIPYYGQVIELHKIAQTFLETRNKAYRTFPEFYARAQWDGLPFTVIQELLQGK